MEVKIVVVGGGGVGKTALTVQFTENQFSDVYDPTIEDTYRKQVTVDGEKYILSIVDTAGQEEYTILRDSYWRNGDGYLLCYDMTSAVSFEEIPSFRESILRAKDTESFPMILCGNKADLADVRQVSKEDGNQLAQSFDCPLFETSAKNRINVEDVFYEITRQIKRYKSFAAEGSSSSSSKSSGDKKGFSWKFWKKSK